MALPAWAVREDRSRVVALALAGSALLFLLVAVRIFAQGPTLGYDFAAYYDAARRLSTGLPVYQAETLAGPFRPGPGGLYLYPPPLAALLTPLVGLPVRDAALVWLGFKLVLLIATFAVLPVHRTIRLVAFAFAVVSAPVLIDLNLGNVSTVVLFAAALMWRWLDRPAGALSLALAVFLRPALAVVVVSWLLRGRLALVACAVVFGVSIVVLTLPLTGLTVYGDYMRLLANVHGVTGVPRNVDLASAALALGATPETARVALASGYLLAIAALVVASRRDPELSLHVSVGASILLSPLLWPHYLSLITLTGPFLAHRGRRWGLLLPLLGWLPEPALATAGIAVVLAPFLAGPRAEAGVAGGSVEAPAAVDAAAAGDARASGVDVLLR